MNHNHIYSDSVSCEQLKAVDIISKEESHVCPTSPLTPPPHKKINNNKQTNEKYTNIVQTCSTSTLLIEYISVSSLLVYQSTHEGYYRNVPDEGYYRNVPGEKMTRRKWEFCNLPLYQQPRGSYYSCHFWFSMQSFLGACCICYILSGRDLTSFETLGCFVLQ